MLWTITVVLLVLWILGFTAFHTVGAWVHLLLVLAVISVAINLIRGRRAI
ncbi:MAG: lmo0937 family membrane protein [Polyangiales bacterium]